MTENLFKAQMCIQQAFLGQHIELAAAVATFTVSYYNILIYKHHLSCRHTLETANTHPHRSQQHIFNTAFLNIYI